MTKYSREKNGKINKIKEIRKLRKVNRIIVNKEDFNFQNLQSKKIFLHLNHLYFSTAVTQKNIDIMIQLINLYKENLKKNQKIKKTKKIKPLYLHICSNGGSIHAGYIAYDYIKMSNIPIYTVAEGMVASMATTLCMAGVKRFMLPSSFMLIHQLRSRVKGTFNDICDEHINLCKIMDYDIEIYLKECRGKLTLEQIKEMLNHETVLNFKECLEYGFVDEEYKEKLN